MLFDTSLLDNMNILEFLATPIPKGKTIQMQIKRDKSGLKRFHPKFYLYTNKDYRYNFFLSSFDYLADSIW